MEFNEASPGAEIPDEAAPQQAGQIQVLCRAWHHTAEQVQEESGQLQKESLEEVF